MTMRLTQRISTYSYIDRPAIELGAIGTSDTDAALLVQIESLLSAAAASFNARKYNDALTAYFSRESLIYAHLDPQWDLRSRRQAQAAPATRPVAL